MSTAQRVLRQTAASCENENFQTNPIPISNIAPNHRAVCVKPSCASNEPSTQCEQEPTKTASTGGASMRYLCIHSHFYQPPRENPWLEAIELQDSAYPTTIGTSGHRRVLRAQQGRAHSRCGRPHLKIVNNYSPHEFQFRTHPAVLDEGQSARRPTGAFWRRTRERGPLLRTRLGDGPVLQPHDHAAGQRARQVDAGGLGHRRFPAPLWPRAGRHVAARNRR